MTEAEAKTKWCPFTFAIPEQRGPDGCGIREAGPWLCSGSACMAWHQNSIHAVACIPEGANNPGIGWMPFGRRRIGDNVFDEYVAIDPETKTITGHCGLAGRP